MSVVPVGKAYRLTDKTGDAIQIGDPTDDEFSPKATLNYWGGECWLKFSFDDSEIATKNVQLTADNKVAWSTPLFDFIFYGIDEGDGGLELKIILKQKPPKNAFEFPIQAQNLIFYYQQPLSREFDPADCVELSETYARLKNGEEFRRHENVVGSYAIYHNSKVNGKYKAGKAGHIYLPKLIDSDGKIAWGEFNSDLEQTHVLSVTLPQDFLDSAKYPITIDPTFGKTDIGASTHGGSAGYIRGTHYPLSEAATVTKISLYCYTGSGTSNCKTFIYDLTGSNPNNLEITSSETQLTTTAQWYDFTASGNLSAMEHYLMWMFSTGELNTRYDTGAANSFAYKPATYPTPPNPFGSPEGNSTRLTSIYATYSTGGTLKAVTDSTALSDSILRHKTLLPVTQTITLSDVVLRHKTLILYDSLGLADSLYGNKFLLLGDSASLSELITIIIGEAIKQVTDSVNIADIALTPSRVLQVLEAIGATDNFAVNKVLQITETVSLAEVVEVGVGGVKKTRLFLVLGDLAVQLTGD